MLPPAATGLGVPLLLKATSQASVTGVVTVVLLLARLGSEVVEDTDEVAVMVVAATVEVTFTTTIMFATAPEARLAGPVQVTLPVAPTAGVVQDQPTGMEIEAKVVLVGTASTKVTPVAAAGPLFVTV
jgi:hypothetical protein